MQDLLKVAALQLAILTPHKLRAELAGFCFHFGCLVLKCNTGKCLAALENREEEWLNPLKDFFKARYHVEHLYIAAVRFSEQDGMHEGGEIARFLGVIETTLGDSDNAHRTDFHFQFS